MRRLSGCALSFHIFPCRSSIVISAGARVIEMIAAKKSDQALLGILAKIEPYVNYIVDIMYRVYGGEQFRECLGDALFRISPV